MNYKKKTLYRVCEIREYLTQHPGSAGLEIRTALGWGRRAAEERLRAAVALGAAISSLTPPEHRRGGRRKFAYYPGTVAEVEK